VHLERSLHTGMTGVFVMDGIIPTGSTKRVALWIESPHSISRDVVLYHPCPLPVVDQRVVLDLGKP
jgi:hypothetical protein